MATLIRYYAKTLADQETKKVIALLPARYVNRTLSEITIMSDGAVVPNDVILTF